MRRESIATVLGGVIAAAAVFSLSTQSCGLIDNGGVGGIEAGVPTMRIVAPSNGCVVAYPGDIPFVPISLAIDNLQLQPPGVCSQQLTTVSSTATGFGGAGGAGGGSLALPCGHLAVFVCSQASAVDDSHDFWGHDEHKHCPGLKDPDAGPLQLTAPPNNQGSGTEIDALLPDLRDPTPEMPFNEIHVDVVLVREARFVGEILALEAQVPPQGLDLSVAKPGGVCPGGGGASGTGGAGGKGGAGGV